MLKLWELAPSPNNTKVRMALRYKGIAFEAIPVDPADRAKVIGVSGQEATPVIEDKGIVLNDSEAILQYLDANYRDAPRLFPADKAGRRACEEWDDRIKEKLVPGWAKVFFWAIGRQETLDPKGVAAYADGLRWLADELGDRTSFAEGDDRAAMDIRAATWAGCAFPSAALAARVPIFTKFAKATGLEPGSLPKLEAFLAPWNERLE